METLEKSKQYCEPIISSSEHEDENYIFGDDKDQPFDILIKWEGVIQNIQGDTIYSNMYCVNDGENYDLEFDKSEVSKDDIDLVDEGAIFNLYIGYDRKSNGAIKTKLYKFRRINLENKLDNVLESLKNNDLRSLVEDY